jgi:two-component system, OmpR family, response regulator RpaA
MGTDRLVLVIDDDPVFSHVVSVFLRRAGYEVLMAADGIQGQRTARIGNPDAIIIDYQMPGGNGLVIAERIKANAATAHIPILMLTGTVMEDLDIWAHRAGIEQVLDKVELSEEQLTRALEQAFTGFLDPARCVDATFASF